MQQSGLKAKGTQIRKQQVPKLLFFGFDEAAVAFGEFV